MDEDNQRALTHLRHAEFDAVRVDGAEAGADLPRR